MWWWTLCRAGAAAAAGAGGGNKKRTFKLRLIITRQTLGRTHCGRLAPAGVRSAAASPRISLNYARARGQGAQGVTRGVAKNFQ